MHKFVCRVRPKRTEAPWIFDGKMPKVHLLTELTLVSRVQIEMIANAETKDPRLEASHLRVVIAVLFVQAPHFLEMAAVQIISVPLTLHAHSVSKQLYLHPRGAVVALAFAVFDPCFKIANSMCTFLALLCH